MDFYLTNIRTGQRVHFPMNPERVSARTGSKMQTFTLPEIGDISFPKGQAIATITWEGKLPGEKRKDMGFVREWTKPTTVMGLITEARDSGDKLKLLITETPLNLDVYVQDFEHNYSGGFGDIDYSITLVKAREIKVYTEAEWRGRTAAAVIGEATPKLKDRPAPPPQQTYTVKSGDTLWLIAKKTLQDGSKWPIIYNDANNRKLIGANPNLIQVGWVLRIPSGTAQEGGVYNA